VGKSAKPGDAARNTGVIVLIVPKETSKDGAGHLRIETGYGSEGFITTERRAPFATKQFPSFASETMATASS